MCARARERDNNCAYNAHLHKYVFVKSDLNWIELGQAYKNNNNSPNQFVCCTGWMMAAADVFSFSLIFTLSRIAREFWPLLTLMATAVASVTKIKTNLLLASTTHVKIPNCQSISFSNANEHRDLQFKECSEERERNECEQASERSIDRPPREKLIFDCSYLPSRINIERPKPKKNTNKIGIRRFELFAAGILCSHKSVWIINRSIVESSD